MRHEHTHATTNRCSFGLDVLVSRRNFKRLGLAPQGLVYKSTNIHFYNVCLDKLSLLLYKESELISQALRDTASYLLNKMAEAQFINENDPNDYPIVKRFGNTNYKLRWRQQTVKNAGH